MITGPRVSAKAFVTDGERLLLIECRDNESLYYTIAGGGQDRYENLHETLKRECREELGVEIEVGELLVVRDYIARNHEFAAANPEFHQIELMFRCHARDPDHAGRGGVLDNRQVGVRWVPFDELASIRLYPKILKPILAARLRGGSGPIYLGDVN